MKNLTVFFIVAHCCYMNTVMDFMDLTDGRRRRDAVIRARCDSRLRDDLQHVAALLRVDVSEVIREACSNYIIHFHAPPSQN